MTTTTKPESTPRATAKNCFQADEEGRRWLADASELGFPPGLWPRTIETDLGNGRPLMLLAAGVDFHTFLQPGAGGIRLNVCND